MLNLEIDINIHDKCWRDIIDDIESFTHKIINQALEEIISSDKNIDISIVLANDIFVQELNKNYRNKDKPTNVLSFPQTEQSDFNNDIPFISLGDIIIAFETIECEAKEQNKSFNHHYAHMLTHGCLHLLHFDHQTEEKAKIMESKEIAILSKLDIKNPYEII